MSKDKLTILIRKILSEVYLVDERETFEDMVYGMEREIFNAILNQEKIRFRLIPKASYHTALREFIKYGRFMRFPEKIIYKWKGLILNNIATLNALTSLHGHSSGFPFDEFYDEFDNEEEKETNQFDLFTKGLSKKTIGGEYTQWVKNKFKETNDKEYLEKYNFYAAYEFLDKVYNIDDITPQFSNGHHVLSDYATELLLKLGEELDKKNTPEEIIVVINKILDVVHQRSDIAEIFIEGGIDSLEYITNAA